MQLAHEISRTKYFTDFQFWTVLYLCYVATGIGDPHMITFDGVEYTFNGYGEYQILQVSPPEFKLQGRMQPLISDDGNKTRGTVYKAFAMKENGSDVVQVNANQSRSISSRKYNRAIGFGFRRLP